MQGINCLAAQVLRFTCPPILNKTSSETFWATKSTCVFSYMILARPQFAEAVCSMATKLMGASLVREAGQPEESAESKTSMRVGGAEALQWIDPKKNPTAGLPLLWVCLL